MDKRTLKLKVEREESLLIIMEKNLKLSNTMVIRK